MKMAHAVLSGAEQPEWDRKTYHCFKLEFDAHKCMLAHDDVGGNDALEDALLYADIAKNDGNTQGDGKDKDKTNAPMKKPASASDSKDAVMKKPANASD